MPTGFRQLLHEIRIARQVQPTGGLAARRTVYPDFSALRYSNRIFHAAADAPLAQYRRDQRMLGACSPASVFFRVRLAYWHNCRLQVTLQKEQPWSESVSVGTLCVQKQRPTQGRAATNADEVVETGYEEQNRGPFKNP